MNQQNTIKNTTNTKNTIKNTKKPRIRPILEAAGLEWLDDEPSEIAPSFVL